jgi:hypothetical protein
MFGKSRRPSDQQRRRFTPIRRAPPAPPHLAGDCIADSRFGQRPAAKTRLVHNPHSHGLATKHGE